MLSLSGWLMPAPPQRLPPSLAPREKRYVGHMSGLEHRLQKLLVRAAWPLMPGDLLSHVAATHPW